MGRLPRVNRLLYASGSIGGNAIGRSKDLWLLYFYAPPEDADIQRRATTLMVGVVLFSIRFIEAFDDPLIGYWSDRTRSRWGRRIPFVIAATPFLSLMFVFIWLPPSGHESTANAVYLFFVLALFHLFSTLSGGPFESLLPEIARTNEDRLSIVSWQVAFGVAGAALALVGSGFIIDIFGFPAMALLMATIALISRFVALGGAWRPAIEAARTPAAPPPSGSFWKSVTTCMRNDQFVLFLPTYIFYNMGVLMITGVIPFLAKEVLEYENEGTISALINAVAIGVLVLALPLIVRLAKRQGKRRMYSLGMLYASCSSSSASCREFPGWCRCWSSRRSLDFRWRPCRRFPTPSSPTSRTTIRCGPASAGKGRTTRRRRSSKRQRLPWPLCCWRCFYRLAPPRKIRSAFALWARWPAFPRSSATSPFDDTGCRMT
jgi:Na+/melibiose symporter-like transporter